MHDLASVEMGSVGRRVDPEEEQGLDYPDWEDDGGGPGHTGNFVGGDLRDSAIPSKGYRDTVTGDELPPKLVCEARREEIDFMEDWKVWDLAPRSEAWWVVQRNRPLASQLDVACTLVLKAKLANCLHSGKELHLPY